MLEGSSYAIQGYANPIQFLDRFDAGPGCVVLELRMPQMSGIELQARLGDAKPPLSIVFISDCPDVPSAVQAIKAGALDFLVKPVTAAALRDAIDRAVATDRARRTARADSEQARERYATLSPQERRVCRLAGDGLLNKQIAWELDLAEQTVRVYRSRAMRKLGVDNLAHLVRFLVCLDM
ncbi:Response regulator protein TodT [Enhygromyxa salina]|uniref:Response regulator protein TodT n=2 Tax=Enhygromyxa salina TaxID=215803 RepID=A0A2S9XT50_9BACT|nr:Response regulator protein TodT [Enhygromyxa salina]